MSENILSALPDRTHITVELDIPKMFYFLYF